MHGRPRLPPGVAPDHSKDREKAEKLNTLLSDVIRNHQERCYTKEALKQSAQLLEINPEVYTAWNYRKVAVQKLMDSEPDEGARKRIAEDELRMVERALRANIKSYGAWHHRRWIIEFGLSSLDHEFLLLKKLLKEDARNFHGWNYRRFVVETKGRTPADELLYTDEKINENFSNYSAWHYRSTLLSQLVEAGMSKEKILTDEYDLVNQAYFTEPDDQSAWFYTSWILGQTKMNSGLRLLGAWPSNGAMMSVSVDRQSQLEYCKSQDPLGHCTRFFSKYIPVVLTFNEVVTGVDVSVKSVPELPALSRTRWSSVSSSVGEPSKTWVTELCLRGCQDTEYAISVEIGVPDIAFEKAKHTFSVNISFSGLSKGTSFVREDQSGTFLWPNSISGDSKRGEDTHCEEGFRSPCLSEEPEFEGASDVGGDAKWKGALLVNQIQNLRDLLDIEQHSKWGKLTLSRVLLVHSTFLHGIGPYTDEVLRLLKELATTDLFHKDFYESLWSSVYMKKVFQSSEMIKQLWWNESKADLENPEAEGWLRWSGFSLSKLDSVERMLWVQRLDISHNRLRNIDGLEAMQLLVALDVSHNLIPGVTSLAVLRLNPQLQFLNISHNEIGSHPVDASRYSFQSALTNRVKRGTDTQNNYDLWEVRAIFGDMHLRVLDISGNAVASDKSYLQALTDTLQGLEIFNGKKVHEGVSQAFSNYSLDSLKL